MTRSICFAVLIGLFSVSCSEKKIPVKITQHTDLTHVTGITRFNGAIYCATKGGLLKWDLPEGRYTAYTTLDGLPSNVLSDVEVDGDGLLWIGSVDGLASFDGSRFKTYDVSDGLPSNEITDVTVDRGGNLWVATAKGVASYQSGRFRFLDDEDGPGDKHTMCVYFDMANNLWIGTDNDGLYSRTGDGWIHWTTRNGFPVNQIVTVVQAWDRSMWAASWAGISRFDGHGWKTFSSMKRFGTYDGRQLISTDKRLWFFTANGVNASQGADWFLFHEEDGLLSNDVTCGYVVSDDEVYAGTVDGMSVIKNGEIKNYFVPSCPVGHNCISIAIDDRDRVWLGTWESGLNLYDSGYWTQPVRKGERTLETVRSVVFRGDGGTVFNTTNGVVFEKDNDWRIYTRRQGVSSNDVRCGVFDREGRYWAGTSGGICCYENNRWKRFRSIHGLPSEDTWACALGGDGTVWFGTAAGIVSFEGTELTDRTPEIGLEKVDVRSIAVDGDRILFGTNDGELIEYSNGKWEVYGAGYVKTRKGIYAVLAVPSGRIWLGTNGDGIIGIGDGGTVRYTVSDGLPSNYVKALAFKDNVLWAACYGGAVSLEFGENGD